MFLTDYERYVSQYAKGAKKIAHRSSYPKIEQAGKLDIKLEKSHGNYDLYFNNKGVLLWSFHYEKSVAFKNIYAYDRKGKIIRIMKLSIDANELIGIGKFYYDKQGRIKKEIMFDFLYALNCIDRRDYIHTYKGNTLVTDMLATDAEAEGRSITIYDDNNRAIENKLIRSGDELVSWEKNEYGQDGNLIKRISLDENGKEDGVYEYFKNQNGNDCFRYTSKNGKEKFEKEYSYTYDERGAWIYQAVIGDGIPQWFYERKIEYYTQKPS